MPDTLLTVTRRVDPLDHIGHDPRSLYAEPFWLGHLGPSSLWLLRLFAHHFDTTDTFTIDIDIDIAHVAQTIGLSSSLSRLRKTIERLERFALLTTTEVTTLAVRSALPWLPVADVHRLPDTLRIEHQHAVDEFTTTHPADAELRDIAAHVASMRRRGTGTTVIAQVLSSWNVSPDTATAVLAA